MSISGTAFPAYHVYNQTDIVSNVAAFRWVAECVSAHEQAGLAMENLHVNVLTSDFPWERFLMGRPWGRQILDLHVTTMTLVMWNDHRTFAFATLAEPGRMRHIVFQACEKTKLID